RPLLLQKLRLRTAVDNSRNGLHQCLSVSRLGSIYSRFPADATRPVILKSPRATLLSSPRRFECRSDRPEFDKVDVCSQYQPRQLAGHYQMQFDQYMEQL